jgi:hypothetical protein
VARSDDPTRDPTLHDVIAPHSDRLESFARFWNQFRAGVWLEEAHMPGDPKECRQHAVTCRRLADEANTVSARETFLNLADTWERHAAELENAELFIKTMEEIEPTPLQRSSETYRLVS